MDKGHWYTADSSLKRHLLYFESVTYTCYLHNVTRERKNEEGDRRKGEEKRERGKKGREASGAQAFCLFVSLMSIPYSTTILAKSDSPSTVLIDSPSVPSGKTPG